MTYERNRLKDTAENEQRKFKSLEKAQEGLDGLVEQVLSSWASFTDMSFYIHGMTSTAAGLKADYLERSRKTKVAKTALEETQKSLACIQNMEPYHHEGVRYVIAEFKDLRPDLIDRCIIINKADKDTIFPTILKFRSEQDFHTYQYKTTSYLFAVNPAITLVRLNDEIARLQNKCQLLTTERPDYRQLLTEKLTKFLQDELKLNEQHYYEAEEKQLEIQSKIYTLEMQREEYKEEIEEQYSRSEKEDQLKYEAEKSRIMKVFKGQYSFVWKRERKSWSDAFCPIYFDIGKDYLFERTEVDTLVKVSIAEFLSRHLG